MSTLGGVDVSVSIGLDKKRRVMKSKIKNADTADIHTANAYIIPLRSLIKVFD